ncbi:MAG: hypothetical protein HY699_14450 [Deltaproteobacteria bacterium]|nr:hypothetical protein [Deltaproteobacteria bacterium]
MLAKAVIDDTVVIEGRVFRVGVLAGVPVVLGLTGIGLTNAGVTTRALLERFEVAGVVVSGVAGSSLRIADVSVPATWVLADGTSYSADPGWLALAGDIAQPRRLALERCTLVPAVSLEEPVCLPHEPAVVIGGVGQSSDTFGDTPFPCQAAGDDVFGCDVTTASAARAPAVWHALRAAASATAAAAPVAEDMETAAIAREAVARGLPFIAFRAVSDGAGDPLGLPGFPAQFFAYYHLAANNAAAATLAFLDRLADAS